MDLAVTVGAASVKEENRSRRPRRHRVTRCVMTRSAEPRVRDFEEPIIDGSVGLMAIATVFKYRRMCPQKWPSPLGVTGVTVLIDAGLFELGRIGGAVRIVAARTNELSFSHRHMRRTIELRVSLQVALAANFYLRPFIKKRCLLAHFRELLVARPFHYRMAGDTREPAVGVGTGFPIGLNSALMASETGSVLDFC